MLKTRNIFLAFAVVVCAIVLASCSTSPTKQQIGLVTGGAVGALAGSAFGGGTGKVVATGIGAVGGALVGSEIGKSMQSMNSPSLSNSATGGNPYQYIMRPDTAVMYV